MKVGIIDAEIIGKNKHRFPNLCCMKLSSYHKNMGDEVSLLLSYNDLYNYDKVYISKVFTKTPVPHKVLSMETVEYGGTGFFYDKAPSLSIEIEHSMPDYHLYDDWVDEKLTNGAKRFKQGLDERLLTEDKILKMTKWKYDGEVIFAFDSIKDKEVITSKLMLIRAIVPKWSRELKFYIFCGCDENEDYDEAFWQKDIADLFERIFILKTFGAKPYVMRFETVYDSEYSSFYATVAAWCNQPSMFNTFSFRLFAQCRGMKRDGYKKHKRDVAAYLAEGGSKGSEWRSMEFVAERFPQIAQKYFDFTGKPLCKYEWLDELLES